MPRPRRAVRDPADEPVPAPARCSGRLRAVTSQCNDSSGDSCPFPPRCCPFGTGRSTLASPTMNMIASYSGLKRVDRMANVLARTPSARCWWLAIGKRRRGGNVVLAAAMAFCLLLSGVAVAPGQATTGTSGGTSGAAALLKDPSSFLNSSTEPGDTSAKSLEARLAEARANLAAAEVSGDAALATAPTGISGQDIAIRRALLQRLVRLFEQQLSNAAELETVKKRKDETAHEAQEWTRFPDPPPYSILLTDRLREEIQAEQLTSAGAKAALETLDQLVTENRRTVEQAEETIRQLNERLEANTDPATPRLSWQRDLEASAQPGGGRDTGGSQLRAASFVRRPSPKAASASICASVSLCSPTPARNSRRPT